MRTLALFLALLMVVGMVPAALAKDDDEHDHHNGTFRAQLSGFNEVHSATAATPERGAVSTDARGTFKAELVGDVIHYELRFEGLSADVTQAHIHFGQRHTVGGIVVWLCQAINRAPADVSGLTPECDAPNRTNRRANTVTGTIVAAQVIEVAGQGIAPREFEEFVRALRAGVTYANVHSVNFGPGEIRGQIHRGKRDKD